MTLIQRYPDGLGVSIPIGFAEMSCRQIIWLGELESVAKIILLLFLDKNTSFQPARSAHGTQRKRKRVVLQIVQPGYGQLELILDGLNLTKQSLKFLQKNFIQWIL